MATISQSAAGTESARKRARGEWQGAGALLQGTVGWGRGPRCVPRAQGSAAWLRAQLRASAPGAVAAAVAAGEHARVPCLPSPAEEGEGGEGADAQAASDAAALAKHAPLSSQDARGSLFGALGGMGGEDAAKQALGGALPLQVSGGRPRAGCAAGSAQSAPGAGAARQGFYAPLLHLPPGDDCALLLAPPCRRPRCCTRSRVGCPTS